LAFIGKTSSLYSGCFVFYFKSLKIFGQALIKHVSNLDVMNTLIEKRVTFNT